MKTRSNVFWFVCYSFKQFNGVACWRGGKKKICVWISGLEWKFQILSEFLMNPAMLKSKRGQTLKSEQVVENVVL